MFELLFKYPVNTWQHAEFVWSSGWSARALLLCLLLALVIVAFSLFRQKLSLGKRVILGLLQFTTLATLFAMLWQPALRMELMLAGENTVAYLLDTSKSMHSNDTGSSSRLQEASDFLGSDSLIDNDQFDASVYGFGDSLTPLSLPLENNNQNLTIDNAGARSAVADSLLSVLESVNDQALAAVVVLSDGADNASEISSQWWQSIKAAGVPVHTVGFGNAVVENDVELREVFLDSQVGENASVTARLRIVHQGYPEVRLRVESGDELLHAQNLLLDQSLSESVHTISFNSGDAGVKEFQFSVSAKLDAPSAEVNLTKEVNQTNNVQRRVVNVADQPKRVLYVEGEPRWEYKFIRRALHNYGGVELVSLLRTSPNKFYRQGVESAQELEDGFPKTREVLFAYDAIIIGSLEAAELSTEQQANLRDFVSERGGSLLMLAGQHGLGDGGWGRSAVAAALPAKLSGNSNARDYERIRVSVQPTIQGLRTPWLRLDEDDAANLDAWSNMPEVNDIQTIGVVKPGSTTLLSAQLDSQPVPLLVWHRYGQGQSFILGTSGTWRWQMALPSENQWHEVFWQQISSQLVAGSLPQLSIDDMQAVYRDTTDIPITVTARQADFQPLSDGELSVNVTTPSGQQIPTSLIADIDQPGRYKGSISATEDGPYAITMAAPMQGEAQAANEGSDVQKWLLKESDTAEQFDTGLHREFLQRISAATGGRYLDAADKDQLAQVLTMQNAGITKEEILPLWNMLALFLLLIVAKALEWLLRLRWKRL